MSNVDGAAAGQAGVPRPGDVLAGKFRVEQVLGVGGMGVVVAAHHLHLDQRVALKFLLPEVVHQSTIIERFAREARTAAKIQSEHVTRVIDVGAMENGAPYIVMEYLDGNDLAVELESRGPLPIATAIDYVLQACEAIAEAHVMGIVHRDLKPANLFLTRRPDGGAVIKVLDFGISKQRLLEGVDQSQIRNLTQTSAQLGSPAYMSPEQLKSAKDADERSDVWALGLIVHELLTGKIAFSATTVAELHVAILTEPPQPLRQARPDASAELEAVVARCLIKDAAGRIQNVAELAQALAPHGTAQAHGSAERIARVLGTPAPRTAGPSTGLSAGGVAVGGSDHTQAAGAAPAGAGTPAAFAASGVRAGPSGVHAQPQAGGPHGAHPGAAPAYQQHPPAAPPMRDPMASQPHFPPGYAPGPAPHHGGHYSMGASYVHPPRQSNTALIILLVLVGFIVLGMGSCMMCVCLGAAADSSNQSR